MVQLAPPVSQGRRKVERRTGEKEGALKGREFSPVRLSTLKILFKIKFRIFVKKSSDFNQKAPPIFRLRLLGPAERDCLAPPEAGLGSGKDFEGIFEIQKQFLPAQTEVRFAEGKHKFEKFINQSFFFRWRQKAKR